MEDFMKIDNLEQFYNIINNNDINKSFNKIMSKRDISNYGNMIEWDIDILDKVEIMMDIEKEKSVHISDELFDKMFEILFVIYDNIKLYNRDKILENL